MPAGNSTVHALIYDLNDELASELLSYLQPFCREINSVRPRAGEPELQGVADSSAQIIFCNPDTRTVRTIHTLRPDASIIVVSRDPEMVQWLDSMEAGAADYCTAPFDSSQLQWIVRSSIQSSVPA